MPSTVIASLQPQPALLLPGCALWSRDIACDWDVMNAAELRVLCPLTSTGFLILCLGDYRQNNLECC